MKTILIPMLTAALAVSGAYAQGSGLIWSTFSTGHSRGTGDSIAVQGMAGQMFAGSTSGDGAAVGGGFFSGFKSTGATLSIPLTAGWNMVSVPLSVDSYEKSALFPDAISGAYTFEDLYVQKTTLANGVGYWLKFPDAMSAVISGDLRVRDTLGLLRGWNMIGSVSQSIPVNTVTSIPPGMVTSPFFGFSGFYQADTVLEAGKAYWVKVAQDGMLVLSSSGTIGGRNSIIVVPTDEVPPAESTSIDSIRTARPTGVAPFRKPGN